MSISLLFTVNSIIAAVFGLAFLIAPGQAASVYGVAANAPFRYLAQLFGAEVLGFAVLTWLARRLQASDARRAIVMGLFVANAVGFVVSLLGQVASVVSSVGWSTVLIYLLLALGWGFFQFLKPTAA